MKSVSGNLSSEDHVTRTVVRCFVGIPLKIIIIVCSSSDEEDVVRLIKNIEEVARYSGFILTSVSYTHLDVYKRQPENLSTMDPPRRGRTRAKHIVIHLPDLKHVAHQFSS